MLCLCVCAYPGSANVSVAAVPSARLAAVVAAHGVRGDGGDGGVGDAGAMGARLVLSSLRALAAKATLRPFEIPTCTFSLSLTHTH